MNTVTLNKRNSSIETLKVIAILLIILSSALPYSASYNGDSIVYINLNITDFSFTHILCTLFRWCGQLGDDIFIVCSAWFLCEKSKVKLNKVMKMIMDSWLISVVALIIAWFFISPSFREIIKSFFPITFELNWFIGCYIIYYAIHPFINKAVEDLKRNQFKLLIIILFFAYFIIGTIGSEKYYYNTPLVLFICLHLFVLYIKKYNIFDKISDKKCIGVIFSCAIVIVGWIIALNFFGTYYFEWLHTRGLLFYRFCNPLLIAIAMAMLCLATKRNFYKSWVNTLSSNSLQIYLLHGNYFWLIYGKYFTYELIYNTAFFNDKPLLITIFCMEFLYIVFVPIISIIYNKTVGKLGDILSEFITKKLSNMIGKLAGEKT